MKIRVRRVFKYTFDNITTHSLTPGEYDVPAEVSKEAAQLAIQFGAAVLVRAEKVAPENKVKAVAETKAPAKTGKKAK